MLLVTLESYKSPIEKKFEEIQSDLDNQILELFPGRLENYPELKGGRNNKVICQIRFNCFTSR